MRMKPLHRYVAAAALLAGVLDVHASVSAMPPDPMFMLDLGGRRFDPRVDPQAAIATRHAGAGLRLVQFNGPLRPEWLEGLAREGATPLQYIHPYSYVVWADTASLARTAQLDGVRWQGDFLPEYKLAPQARSLDATRRPALILLSRHADRDELVSAMRELGADIGPVEPVGRHFSVARVELSGERFSDLAALRGVYAVQEIEEISPAQMQRGEMSNQSIVGAHGAGPSHTIVPGYTAWYTAAGLDGTGVTVGIVDGGVHVSHPEINLPGKVQPCVNAGTGTTSCNPGTDAHGTHVAAAVAGVGVTTAVNNGFLRGQGVAPGANVVRQIYDPFLGGGPGGVIANGMLTLYRESALSGAVLTNNSWGPSDTPRGYDIPTQQVDFVARDALSDVPGQQPVLDVRSIMNGDGDANGACQPSSLGTPDEAKNLFAVGSTKLQGGGGSQQAAIFDVSANSAHGNACDGRRRPDIVAPGCSTESASSATGYGTMCGTSMASPVVSGAAALFVEKYRVEHGGATPSPALIKAAFTAVAKDLAGFRNADGGTMGHRPDRFQGYGRLDLDAVINPAAAVMYLDQTEVFTASGQQFRLTAIAADPARPMRIMLAFTDAPGHGLGGTTPAWVNDLDLSVEADGDTYFGNVVGGDGWSATGGTADGKNNLEGVFLSPAQHGGVASITVDATNIAADALNPHAPGAPAQDFALVCYNCLQGDGFGLALEPASAEVCAPADATTTVSVLASGSFDGAVTLAASDLPSGLSAAFAPTLVDPAPGTSMLTLGNTAAVLPGTYSILIEGTSPGEAARSVGFDLSVAAATPEAPTLVSPLDVAANVSPQTTLEWSAVPGASGYRVEVADSLDFSNLVFSEQTEDTSLSVAPALDFRSTYYWRVIAQNACGEQVSAAFSFGTAPAPGDCPVGMRQAPLLFGEVFSSGLGGFATTGSTGSGTWGVSISNPSPGSGGNAALAQGFATPSDQRLISPAIDLPADLALPTLRFLHAVDVETNAEDGGCWDGGLLEISTDGGTSYAQISGAALLTQPYVGIAPSANPLSGKPVWCGEAIPWTLNVIDLSAYAGQSVTLRWRLGTDTAVGTAPNGWRIDDIAVGGCESVRQGVDVFRDGFE
jgi:serine protease AprX